MWTTAADAHGRRRSCGPAYRLLSVSVYLHRLSLHTVSHPVSLMSPLPPIYIYIYISLSLALPPSLFLPPSLSPSGISFYLWFSSSFSYPCLPSHINSLLSVLPIRLTLHHCSSVFVSIRYCVSAHIHPHILCYSEEAVFVFNTQSSEWVQTICLKKPRPLSHDGSLSIAYVSDVLRLVYIKPIVGQLISLLSLSVCPSICDVFS